LGHVSRMIAQRLEKVPGTLDVSTDYRDDAPGLLIEPKPEILGLANLTKTQLARAVQTAIAGDTSIEITLDDEDVELRLQLAPEYQRHPKELERLLLTAPGGMKAPIGSLAELHRHTELFSVNRYERNRAVVTRSNVDDSRQPAQVFEVLSTQILRSEEHTSELQSRE